MAIDETQDFHEWIYRKAQNTSPQEIAEDNYVACRLLRDILYGRSKKFNRTKDTGKDYTGGMDWLHQEYQAERRGDDEL